MGSCLVLEHWFFYQRIKQQHHRSDHFYDDGVRAFLSVHAARTTNADAYGKVKEKLQLSQISRNYRETLGGATPKSTPTRMKNGLDFRTLIN